MDLLSKFEAVAEIPRQLNGGSLDPTNVVMDQLVSATEAVVQGRSVILAGTNNYLGLTFDAECIEAGKRALDQAGTGTTGSRMANGNFTAHQALERELAEFYDMPHAVVFPTGYVANLGTLCGLLGADDCVLLDADAHASLYDGARMSGAEVYRFKHNDPASLDAHLRRLKARATRTLIVTEGLYSILGDTAPLAEFVAIKQRYGAYLLVDEAHSLGVYGDRGRGLSDAAGVLPEVDFIVGTFSKSLGATGGFCVSAHKALALLRYTSRPYIFTASASPSVIATTRTALALMQKRPQLRQQLWRNAHELHAGLSNLKLQLGSEISPIVSVGFDSREAALACWHSMMKSGVYTNLVVPPASPDGSSLIRCSISAAHTSEQIQCIVDAFANAIGAAESAKGAASV